MKETKAYYLDSSALIKKYLREPGTPYVKALFQKEAFFYTSGITYAECYSAFFHARRMGLLSLKRLHTIEVNFENDWTLLEIIEFNSEVRKEIPIIISQSTLRGMDAIHLSSSLILYRMGISVIFLSSDTRLLTAAGDQGLSVLNPADQ